MLQLIIGCAIHTTVFVLTMNAQSSEIQADIYVMSILSSIVSNRAFTCRALNMAITILRVQALRFFSCKCKTFFRKNQRKVFLIISVKLAVWN